MTSEFKKIQMLSWLYPCWKKKILMNIFIFFFLVFNPNLFFMYLWLDKNFLIGMRIILTHSCGQKNF